LAGDDITPEQRANPSMASWGNTKYLADQKRRLPTHKYRRLHLNLPGAPDGAAFNADAVMEAIVPGRKQLPPDTAHSYYGFTDMSGGSASDAVLGIAHGEDGRIVLDVLVAQTGTPPFNPRAAVTKFAAVLREYDLHRVTGDAFAGETFRRDFQDEGIFYDVSQLSRSQLYEAFEPKLNAGLVELLDVPKLQEQLLTLVVKGSGRIDHMSGDHDDWANAAAGAIVSVATTTGAALVRPADLLAEGAALPVPRRCDFMSAVLCADLRGQCAVVFVATPHIGPTLILDFMSEPMSATLFQNIAARADELTAACPPMAAPFALYADPVLVQHATAHGVDALPLPGDYFADPHRLAVSAGAHTTAGSIRLAEPAYARGLSAPLAGALNIRPGDSMTDNALRAAVLAAVAISLDDASIFA
jgi:hypothetical protein